MALTGSEWGPADVAAVTGNGNGYNDGFGGGAWWLLVLFLFAFAGNGWGNGFGGGNGGGSTYIGIDGAVQRGFDQSAVMGGINGINAGISGIQQALCNGFAGVSNGFAQAEIAENARQMANMNQMFALQSQFAECLKKISNKAREIFGFMKVKTVGTYA